MRSGALPSAELLWLGQECPEALPHLCHQLQVVHVVLLGDDELVDVALPLPLGGGQHVQQVQVSTPCKTQPTEAPRALLWLCAEGSLLLCSLLPPWHSNASSLCDSNIPFNTFFIYSKAHLCVSALPWSKSPSPLPARSQPHPADLSPWAVALQSHMDGCNEKRGGKCRDIPEGSGNAPRGTLE